MKSKLTVIFIMIIIMLSYSYNYSQTEYEPLITNIFNRSTISLDGKWDIIIDPFENGYYNHKYEMRGNGFFKNQKPKTISDLIEYDFDTSQKLNVPGDWNTQDDKLLFYEGNIWYKKSFDYKVKDGKRVFLYFGAVNYECKVFLNGSIVGEHVGGFTPFNFEITDKIVSGENFVVLMINNVRRKDGVPTINTDWWNYGGITRSVNIVETSKEFVRDYFIQLKKGSKDLIEGWVKVDGYKNGGEVSVTIDELNVRYDVELNESGFGKIRINASPSLWTPENPKLFDVVITYNDVTINDRIGFRTIETIGEKILLNGEDIYLKGICIHEEAPYRSGRANNIEDAKILLGWAKELGCNYVRLAHYPHNEYMLKIADELGLMVWSEVPVYWTIQWENEAVYKNALNQLDEMIARDKNRASIVLWSMANETPITDARVSFLKSMIDHTRQKDPTRLVTAALHTGRLEDNPNTIAVDDPLGEYLDVIGINEYLGWYNGQPDKCDSTSFVSEYNKPVIISEFGAGALQGYLGDKLQRWTEDYQEWVYEKNIPMFEKVDFIAGMSPWLLMDFRSPRRTLPNIQDGWNRKGLISEKGTRKKAFYTLKGFYQEK